MLFGGVDGVGAGIVFVVSVARGVVVGVVFAVGGGLIVGSAAAVIEIIKNNKQTIKQTCVHHVTIFL